jgi:hypothetical protein
MIYVKRYPNLIPEKLLRVAERAQQELESLQEEERIPFIKRKSHIWRAFSRCLSRMSYGKCWYSESPDPHSFFDVDHFRPKAEAMRTDVDKDDGYPWLAFSWENFRYAAQRANRLSRDENMDVVVGKGSWFPLLDGSPKACWGNRCIDQENPILLDPTVRSDVNLIDVDSDGLMCQSLFCIGSAKTRVEKSIELYGLNLPRLVEARKRVMRDIVLLHETLVQMLTAGNGHPPVADALPVKQQIEQLRDRTLPNSPYSRAARAQLCLLPYGPQLCAQAEDAPPVT